MADNLANKYRPKSFSDVVEQTLTMKMVQALCENESLNCRNFLFTGPAGTGKTTTCRIIADVLNEGRGEPIEIDAASNSGVDKMRSIVEQAQSYPIGMKYKIFIIDECFTGDTLINTPSGPIFIKDLKPGSEVYNISGLSKVSDVFKNRVDVNNLVHITISGHPTVTTSDHLFFTDNGWIPAKDLKVGDVLYDYSTMQKMWSEFSGSLSQRSQDVLLKGMSTEDNVREEFRKALRKLSKTVSNMWEEFLDLPVNQCNNLWQELRNRMEEATQGSSEFSKSTCKALVYIYLSGLWSTEGITCELSSSDVLTEMRRRACISESCTEAAIKDTVDKAMQELWQAIFSSVEQLESENLQQRMSNSTDSIPELSETSGDLCSEIPSDEIKQSGFSTQYSRKDKANTNQKWDLGDEACYELWQRTLFQTSNATEADARYRVGVRVCSEDRSANSQSWTLSYKLQTRPCLTSIDARNRGGWCRPSIEISTVARREEDYSARIFRVDSIESYKRGSNDELFSCHFPDTEICDAEYVTMYDLEVEGHPSYFANGILVHNCHSLSPAAWQSALKTLEESPAKSVFLFATTNPEKIPATITSRVQTFQLSKISLDGIINRLKYVIDCENKEGRGITYEDSAISYLAKLANGGMRDALTLLDKALAYDTNLTSRNLVEALNLPQYDDYFSLLAAYAKHDNEGVATLVHTVYNSGVNFIKWFEGFHSFVMNVVKYIFMQDIEATMIPSHYADKVSNYGPKHSIVCLKLANKLLKMNAELKTTPYLQEVALTYLCTIPRKEQ